MPILEDDDDATTAVATATTVQPPPVPGSCKLSEKGDDTSRGDQTEQAELSLANKNKVVAALSWKSQNSIDLDVVACIFDLQGQFVDCVFFNNLSAANGALLHTGDEQKSGREEVVIDLHKMPATIGFVVLAVSSASSDDLSKLQGVSLELLESKSAGRDVSLRSVPLPSNSQPFSAFIAGRLYRRAGNEWIFTASRRPVQARSFGDVLPAMQETLKDVLPSIVVQPLPSSLSLIKGETVVITDKKHRVSCVTLGLGWDPIGDNSVDLDGSCVMFNSNGQQEDHVYFSKLKNKNGSILHAGDNTTGDGEGDDEKIFADLSRLENHITSLFFVINSYSGHSFDMIQNAYVRLIQSTAHNPWGAGKELCRFQLSGAGSSSERYTSMLMCKIERHADGTWKLKALGAGGHGRMFQDTVPMMQRELAGRLVTNDNDRKFSFQPQPAASSAGGRSPSSPQRAAPPSTNNTSTTTSSSTNTTSTAAAPSDNTTNILIGLLALLVFLVMFKLGNN